MIIFLMLLAKIFYEGSGERASISLGFSPIAGDWAKAQMWGGNSYPRVETRGNSTSAQSGILTKVEFTKVTFTPSPININDL